MIEFLTNFLAALGFAPAQQPYVWLAALIVAGVIYLQIILGGKMGKMKDNLIVIITHMSNARSHKLDTNLIQAMSPLTIQPAGKEVLEESGFIGIFNANPQRFFQYVSSMDPINRLEVEQYSITSFFIVLNSKDEALNPLQIYLYEHPNVRDTFTTLAGVYIRDEYLKLHPEIKA